MGAVEEEEEEEAAAGCWCEEEEEDEADGTTACTCKKPACVGCVVAAICVTLFAADLGEPGAELMGVERMDESAEATAVPVEVREEGAGVAAADGAAEMGYRVAFGPTGVGELASASRCC